MLRLDSQRDRRRIDTVDSQADVRLTLEPLNRGNGPVHSARRERRLGFSDLFAHRREPIPPRVAV
ncbi:MAG: hypothetical protein F4102_05550 [Chloroflexi bacterium]|nr:hypothetical protein [Chloroflexota bacterium]